MYHYEKRSGQHTEVNEREKKCSPRVHSNYLFEFGDSYSSAFIWFAIGLFSVVAMLAGNTVWLSLVAALLFGYWGWSAFWRARRQLRISRDGMLLSTAEFDTDAPLWVREQSVEIPFAEVSHIDLRGSGIRVERRGNKSPVVFIEGLSSRKKHQFLHLFDLQQRQGAIPPSISIDEPRISSIGEIAKILFAGVMVLWLLYALTL